MGLWQALALIPGTSRSGITITGARLLGYDRHEAARLSMLMSIPTIMASGLSAGRRGGRHSRRRLCLATGAIAAPSPSCRPLRAGDDDAAAAQRVSFTPYVIYRIALG